MKLEFIQKRLREDARSFPKWDGLGKVLGDALIGAELPEEWRLLGDPKNWVARVFVRAVPNGIEYTVFPETKGVVVVPIRVGGVRIIISKDAET